MRVSNRGFTLLELIAAVAIFALVAAMAYGGLNNVLRSESEIRIRAERLAELQRAWDRIGRDLHQAVDRPVRDEFGSVLPAFSGGAQGDINLELTRIGWRNPAGHARSSMQRVAYRLSNGVLERVTWLMLDRPQDGEALRVPVLTGVRTFRQRFLDENREWHEQWPTPAQLLSGAQQTSFGLPRAVEIQLEVEGWGRIERLFLLPGS